MANRKKRLSERKKGFTFSIKRSTMTQFQDKCDMDDRYPSNVVEELIEKYLEED